MFSFLEVMVPMIKGMDDSEEFMIVDVIIPFHRSESLGKISTQVKVSIPVTLHENPPPTGQEGSVGHDNKRLADVREVEHRGCLELGQ